MKQIRQTRVTSYLLIIFLMFFCCAGQISAETKSVAGQAKFTVSGNTSGDVSHKVSGDASGTASGDVVISPMENAYDYADVKRMYDIVYHLNGGVNVTNPSVYQEGQILALASPIKKGYQFEGWYLTSAMNEGSVNAISSFMKGSLNLYAKWSRITYTITYQYNGGKRVAKNPTTYQYQKAPVALLPSTRAGYQFEGWYLAGDGKKISKITNTMIGNLTLQAKWSKVQTRQVKSVKLKPGCGTLQMKAGGVAGANGYVYQYWQKGKKKKSTVMSTRKIYTLTKLKPGKKYCVRIRAFTYDSCGRKVYGKYSKIYSRMIKNS